MTRARDLAAFVSNADGDIKFDTDTLFIDSSANRVGIGRTDPAHPLDVDGEVRFNSNIRLTEATSDAETGSINLADSGLMQIQAFATAGEIAFDTGSSAAERLRIGATGEMQLGGTTNAGFIDFDGTSLQLNTQRNPNTGAFVNTGRSHASIALNGSSADSHIKFYTKDSNNSTGSERWRITKDGHFKAMSNGLGIDFSATEGSGASSAILDDYEEGTWTPGMKAGGTTVTTSNPVGIYRKVGSMVMLQWSITRNDSTGHSGNLTIAGLPFTRATATYLIVLPSGTLWIDNGTGNDRIGWPYLTSSNELVFTQDYRVDGGSRYFQAGNLTNGRPVYGSAHFITV